MSDREQATQTWVDHHGIIVWRIANGPALTVLPRGQKWQARVLGHMILDKFDTPEEAKAAAEKEATVLVRQMMTSLGMQALQP
jgi:hypothetical protein